MGAYYLKNTTGSTIIVEDLGLVLPSNSSMIIDENAINGWLTADLETEIQASNLVLSTTDLSDSSGDMTPTIAIKALTITSEYHTDNPHQVTFTQASDADPNTDISTAEAETLTDGSDATSLHIHDNRYYTITQLTDSNPTTVNVHWDNITDAPEVGSVQWQAPVICRVEGQFSTPPAGSEGQYYLDTDDMHLYYHDGTSWVDQGAPSAEDRFIDKSNDSIYEYTGTIWEEQVPSDGWSVLVSDDGDGKPAQYIYSEVGGTMKWTKIADIDWGTHNQIGGRTASGAHPASSITYNNTLTTSNLDSTVTQNAIDEINNLISEANEEVYVDINRSDSYVAVGTDDKPYKTIADAATALGNSGVIHLAPGTYTEDVNLPGNFSLQGSGGDNTILEGDVTIGDGTPRGKAAMEDLWLKGELTVDVSQDESLEVDRCYSTGNVVVTSGELDGASFSIVPSTSGVTAVTVNNLGEFTNSNSTIESSGDVPTISSTGVVTLNTCQVKGTSTTPVVQSTGGQVRTSFCSIQNSGSGISMDIDNSATMANPNFIQGLSHDSGVDLHDSITVVEGIYGALPTGTNIVWRPARQISYDNTTSGLAAENVQDAIDELGAEFGVELDEIFFVAKNGSDTATGVTLGTLSNPYLTVQAAINAAEASSFSYPVVFIWPGTYSENLTIPPWTVLYALGREPTRIGTNSGTHSITFPGNGRVFIRGVNFRTDAFDISHTVTGSAVVHLEDCSAGAITFTGAGWGDYLQLRGATWLFEKLTIHSAHLSFYDGETQIIYGGGDTQIEIDDDGAIDFDSTTGQACTAIIRDVEIPNKILCEGKTSTWLYNCGIYDTVTADGTDCEVYYDVSSATDNRSDMVSANNGKFYLLDAAYAVSYNDVNANLGADNVQDAIEAILGRQIQGVIFVSRNGKDSPVAPYLGNILNPYLTIQTAFNRIEQNNDNSTGAPYVIWVAPGYYPENLLINDDRFKDIILIGNDAVHISPASGKALEISAQNEFFAQLEIRGVTFEENVEIIGETDDTSAFSDNIEFLDCTFNGSFTAKNIIDLKANGCKFYGDITIENINFGLFYESYHDSSYNYIESTVDTNNSPSGFTHTICKICNSKWYSQITVDEDSELIVCAAAEIGNGSNSISIDGTLTAYNSWIQPSALIIGNTATFTTNGTFFDRSVMTMNGSFVNNNDADNIYYDDTITDLSADNVQDAIDNLKAYSDAFVMPKGTSFPVSPEDAQLFHRTDIGLAFQYDESRSKWLSIAQMFLDWGSNSADGKYMNIHGAAATQTGYLMPYDGTIVACTVRIASGNMDKGFEIRRNHDYSSPLYTFSASTGVYNETSSAVMNINFSAGDYIQMFASSTGIPARDAVAMLIVRWTAT